MEKYTPEAAVAETHKFENENDARTFVEGIVKKYAAQNGIEKP